MGVRPEFYFDKQSISYKRVENQKSRRIILRILFVFLIVISSVITYLFLHDEINMSRERVVAVEQELKNMITDIDLFERELKEIAAVDDSIYRSLFGMTPISAQERHAGIGGRAEARSPKFAYTVSNQIANKLDVLEARIKVQKQSFITLMKTIRSKKSSFVHLPAIMPIANDDLSKTGAGFGMRKHPILQVNMMHEGIDFIAATGTDVYATGKGIIVEKRYSKTFGNVLIIDHGDGIETFYAHLSEFLVNKGDLVQRGQIIGLVGTTGRSTGAHLHYEVHLNGKEMDPVNYFYNDLSAEEYARIVKLASEHKVSLD